MTRFARYGLAAAVLAATLVPTTAHAWSGCRPYFTPKTYDVAGHQVEGYEYAGTLCY
jgi:hypothetical protein